MANEHWPLFDLCVITPRLTLRYLDDALAVELVKLAAKGVHDPATMPFLVPWTDLPSPQLEQEALRFYWSTRSSIRPSSWNLQFAVVVDGQVAGACDLGGPDFVALRQLTTGSWLGQQFQGQGLGKEMRMAALTLAFDGFDAERALTGAWHDNTASLGVTRSLGYTEIGRTRALRRGVADDEIRFRMDRDHWATIRRDDISLDGVDVARRLLGL